MRHVVVYSRICVVSDVIEWLFSIVCQLNVLGCG